MKKLFLIFVLIGVIVCVLLVVLVVWVEGNFLFDWVFDNMENFVLF